MSQDSGTAATLTQGGSVVVSGAAGSGRTATPNAQPTAVNIATSTYPSISNLLNHAGLRYPMCATVQGGSLIYSPMMGQTLFPWRPFTPVATPTTPVSAAVMPNVNLISPPTQTTPSKQVSLAPLMQIPSYSYMTVSSLLGGSGAGGGGVGTSSSSPTDITHQHHSGVTIKRENSEPIDQVHQQAIKRFRLTNETAASDTNNSSIAPSQGSPAASKLMHSGGSSTSSPTELAPYQHLQYPPSALLRVNSDYYSSPPVNNVLLLKCLGLVDSTVIDQYNIKALSVMQDLYIPPRPSFNSTLPALPPETYILLTINYLNSLRSGECVSVEMLRWMFYNTLLGENQWVSYYRKHKKMTESTFVQLQFSHFSRILSSQGNSSDVSVIVSQNSLSEGIFLAVQSILKTAQANLPKFYVVVAVLPNIPSEMCIIVTDQLHCKWLLELQQSVKSLSAIKEPTPQPLVFTRDILTSIKRSQSIMGGRVHTPFLSAGQGGREELITIDEADKVLPSLSSIVEHRPVGPFTELYDMAMIMLQKVLSTGHLDRYQKLDFFIICPDYPPLAAQLVKDVQETGLIQLLGFGDHRDEIHRAINQRIVRCKASNIEAMNETISSNKHVLFLVISKCSHLTSCAVLSHRVVESDPSLESNSTSDCKSILSHTNVSMLYTSAQPYALQTNRAFVPAGNEIHWAGSSTKQQNHSGHEMSSGLEFCSLLRHKSAVPVNAWANVREDAGYEEKVLTLCNNEKLTTPISQIRAQVLLNDYSSAMLSITKKKSSDMLSSLPETLGVVYDLIQRPLGNSRGRGSMVVIRCHSKAVGINLFNKLKGVRKTLGLQYRFEMILDHGDERISISEYFLKRLKMWGVAVENRELLSYLDLDHLPCLVVMTGKVRPSIRLPSSLSHVDLRLCHAHLTRTMYDSDMSLANSYRTVSSSAMGNGGVSHHSKQPSPITSYKSDHHHLSTASSSSMISNEAHVVEWKPPKDITGDHTHWDKSVRSPSSSYKAQFEYSSTDMDCTTSPAINGGVAIVEIPQPEDHMTTTFNEPSSSVAMETEESIFNDLDSDSDYGDSEAENDEGNQRKITCLLSRQYYLIWQSGDATVDQSLLIPPSVGITWQTSSKWTHLSDQTPSGQSSYYRTWSKPEGKAKRVAMDTIMKENSEARQRCYLLTGPNQVGKLGSCLLLIRLVHDYLRSYRGVTAITRLPVLLPFIKTTPPSSPMVTTFSPIVPFDYLTSIHESDAPPSPSSNYSVPHPLPPSDIKPSTVQINAHSTIIHDSSHSCSKCFPSSSNESKPLPPSFHLSSLLQCDSVSLTIQWCVPSSKTKLVSMTSNQTLECIKLPQVDDPSHAVPDVPIISISPDLKESALLNMSHTAEHSPHIIITKTSNFAAYIKSWPQHIIAALPDAVFQCLGYQMHAIQALLHWNYLLNTVRTSSTSTVMPWSLILNDTVCMVLRDGEDNSVYLSGLLKELVTEGEADLISMRPWCHEARPYQSHDCALDSNFLLMNMAKLKGISYNPLNFKSADLDYHLRLLSNGYRVHVSSHYTFVKKHVKLDSPASLASLPDSLSSHPDRLVTSLHHDTSSLLSYPGPLLLEEFLLHKSKSLFSSAHSPNNPVLMIEHYINLGPQVHVSLWTCRELEDRVNRGDGTIDSAMFGGLVLYLCEGLVSSQLLQKLKFVKGACLLLITRDCKGLVREVSRLDIEEYWHFKLRDEFQTACSDQNQPLFFLTGKYVSSNV